MQITYDPEADALYLHFRQGEVDDTLEAGKYVYVDVDEEGFPLGMEILFASRIFDSKEMTSVTFNISHPLAQASD